MRPESAAFLWDVSGAADRIAAFIDGMDEDAYLRDTLRRSAVERPEVDERSRFPLSKAGLLGR